MSGIVQHHRPDLEFISFEEYRNAKKENSKNEASSSDIE